MKITENDLDTSLREKINKLEDIIVSDSNSTSSYIAYENGKFLSKNVNKLNIDKVFSSDEIFKLKDHLYKSCDNYISAYDTLLCESLNSYASSSLLTKLKGNFLFKADGRIIKIKTYDTFFLLLDSTGNMYKINRKNPSIRISKNVVNIIHMNFVYQNFDVFNITDFEYYNNGVLLSTDEHGIYFISFEKEEYTLLIKELYVNKIKILKDKKTLLITTTSEKNNVILYNLDLNVKLNTFNQLGRKFQSVLNIELDNKGFFILGEAYGLNQSNCVLHYWELDAAGAEYENRDKEIALNPKDISYRPKLVKTDDSFVYVIGTKDKEMFVWEYDKENLSMQPKVYSFGLQEFEYDDIQDFVSINGKYYITLGHQILVLDNQFRLSENYLLNGLENFNSVKITPAGVYAIDTRDCYSFFIPKKIYVKATDLTVLNEKEDQCNNIDILIKAPNSCQVIFIDVDTMQKVNPYFYMKMDGIYHVIKLNNILTKNLIMRIGTSEEDKIGGIVIHKNRIFYK